ncbi:hypothetical protein HMPREF9129_1564 [Peptoniphilus indolicus ATCC 29427]|uniref:Uncharacterized protein n=3 Tax=Peptoniphilus indolicus TaxID=33030 RepID=G4D584_9FIRM|nr:hypothetical protein [Peptoniphilus indolicus]EGY79302.1 hypothetical protein HMPREF9129_1564 [Peptoniphilus indolicus ATCC 29427]
MEEYGSGLYIFIIIIAIYGFVFIYGQIMKNNYLKGLKEVTYNRFGKEEIDVKISEEILSQTYQENPLNVDDITFKDLELYKLYKK